MVENFANTKTARPKVSKIIIIIIIIIICPNLLTHEKSTSDIKLGWLCRWIEMNIHPLPLVITNNDFGTSLVGSLVKFLVLLERAKETPIMQTICVRKFDLHVLTFIAY